jgi:hypothetical protein
MIFCLSVGFKLCACLSSSILSILSIQSINFLADKSKLCFSVLSLSIFRFFIVVSSTVVIIVFSTVLLPGLIFSSTVVANIIGDFFNYKNKKK